MSDWYRAGYWCMETLVLTSLHMTAEIQAFFRASHAFGFVIALRRAAKIPSSLVGVFRVRMGREVQSWIEYILGTDQRLFRNVYVRYPRHNSYHYMISG